jgi:hypothetical protein
MEAKPLNPDLPIGHPIKVYRNLRNRLWSIMDARTRKVIGHTNCIVVSDVTFPVNRKGVEKIRETRRKRVVAFVSGKFQGYYGDEECQQAIRFNPYENFTFVDSHGFPVKIADKVNLTASGWVWGKNARVWPPYKA